MRQLAQYDEWCQADGRIIASQVFTFDYNDKQWESFDVALNGMRERIISHVRASGPATLKPDPEPEPEPKPEIEPEIESGTSSTSVAVFGTSNPRLFPTVVRPTKRQPAMVASMTGMWWPSSASNTE